MKRNGVKQLNNFVRRFDEISPLHPLRSRQPPGPVRYEVLERMIDLALQPQRRSDLYFVRNVLRDATRVILRQRGYWNKGLTSLDAPARNPHDDSVEWSHNRAVSYLPDPKAIASAHDLAGHISTTGS